MAKLDPRGTTDRQGPVRTSSGTRAAVRLAPITPSVASRPGANDVDVDVDIDADPMPAREEMPTRELDMEELRAMALRCASDVGAEAPVVGARTHEASSTSPADPHRARARPRLEIIFSEDVDDAPVARARRPARFALVVLVAVLAIATLAALKAYAVLP
jgi:hypothetical protein